MACTHVFETEAYLVLVCLVRLAEQQRKPVRPLNVPLGAARVDGVHLVLVERVGEVLECHRARLGHMLVRSKLCTHITRRVHAACVCACAVRIHCHDDRFEIGLRWHARKDYDQQPRERI